VHVGLGPLVVVLLLLSPPWVIGENRVLESLRTLEDTDWRWWVFGVFFVLWVVPIIAVAGYLQARKVGLETALIRQRFEALLGDKQLPISVDVDTKIPVLVAEPLRIPIEVNTKLAFDERFGMLETLRERGMRGATSSGLNGVDDDRDGVPASADCEHQRIVIASGAGFCR
jgi:hypothetical protein